MNKYISFLFLFGFLNSCGIKKEVTDFSSPPQNVKELIKRVGDKKKTPEFLNLKGKAVLTNGNQRTTLNISIKSKKDSIIWVSANGLFGIEMFRVKITSDSIVFLNRIQKTYFKKTILQLNKTIKTNVSFYDIQAIITANPKIFEEPYIIEQEDTGFYLFSDNVEYFINNNYKVQKIEGGYYYNKIQVLFNNYNSLDNFPRNINVKTLDEEGLELAINFSKVEFKRTKNMRLKIPKTYNEIK